MRSRIPAVLAALLTGCLLVTGCSEARGGPEGFVSDSGTLTMVPADEREPVPDIEGETLNGEPLALSEYDGQVRVLNVWGSWCGPCRSEAPELVAAAERLAKDDVQFLGVNVRDHGQREAAQAFTRRFEVPYPSLFDPDGSSLLGLRPRASAIPSTVVVDADGKVAAIVLGEVTESTLVDLVHDVQGGNE